MSKSTGRPAKMLRHTIRMKSTTQRELRRMAKASGLTQGRLIEIAMARLQGIEDAIY